MATAEKHRARSRRSYKENAYIRQEIRTESIKMILRKVFRRSK